MDNNETLPITDLDQFAFLVANWHMNCIAQLHQALKVPDEVEIAYDLTGSGDDTPLTPEQREGFKVGLTVALSLFQDLPFTVTDMPVSSEGESVAPEVPGHD